MSEAKAEVGQSSNPGEKSKLPPRPGFFDDLPAEIPDPYSIPLESVNPISPRLFQANKHWGYFKRLREEDPVHLGDSQHGRRDHPLADAVGVHAPHRQ